MKGWEEHRQKGELRAMAEEGRYLLWKKQKTNTLGLLLSDPLGITAAAKCSEYGFQAPLCLLASGCVWPRVAPVGNWTARSKRKAG